MRDQVRHAAWVLVVPLLRLLMLARMLVKCAVMALRQRVPVCRYAPASVAVPPAGLNTRIHAACAGGMPRKVLWGYWHAGRENMPGFCRFAVSSWARHHPGWEIVILDARRLGDYMCESDLPSTFHSLLPQMQADLVRLVVLLRFGGIYMDVSTVCVRSLQAIWDAAPAQLYLTTNYPDALGGRFRFPNNALVIARRPEDPVLRRWHHVMKAYLEAPCRSRAALRAHPAFERLRASGILDCAELALTRPVMAYTANLLLLMDLLAFDAPLQPYIREHVRFLPSHGFAGDFITLLPRELPLHLSLTSLICKFWRLSELFVCEDVSRAEQILADATLLKASTNGQLWFHQPPAFHPAMRCTLGRVYRAATDPSRDAAPATWCEATPCPHLSWCCSAPGP